MWPPEEERSNEIYQNVDIGNPNTRNSLIRNIERRRSEIWSGDQEARRPRSSFDIRNAYLLMLVKIERIVGHHMKDAAGVISALRDAQCAIALGQAEKYQLDGLLLG